MKRITVLALALWAGLLLAACRNDTSESPNPSVPFSGSESEASSVQSPPTVAETLLDEQGQVSVAVTPLNLSNPATTLDFEVAMNTHSVDLSMDLATLATLTADNGRSVKAALWDAPLGGHHVSGILSFPLTVEGTTVLEGASHLTLTIHNVDAPERTYTWSLSN